MSSSEEPCIFAAFLELYRSLEFGQLHFRAVVQPATFYSYLAECQLIYFGLKVCLMLSPFRRANRILKLQFLKMP